MTSKQQQQQQTRNYNEQSQDLDHLPLRKRRTLLLQSRCISVNNDDDNVDLKLLAFEEDMKCPLNTEKTEISDERSAANLSNENSQGSVSDLCGAIVADISTEATDKSAVERKCSQHPGYCFENTPGNQGQMEDKRNMMLDTSLPGKVKIEPSDDDLLNHQKTGSILSPLSSSTVKINDNYELEDDSWSDELDHVSLALRREMLLACKQQHESNQLESRIMRTGKPGLMSHHCAVKVEEQFDPLLNTQNGIQGEKIVESISEREGEGSRPIHTASGSTLCSQAEGYASNICGSPVIKASDFYARGSCNSAHQGLMSSSCNEGTESKLGDPLNFKDGNVSPSKQKLRKLSLCKGRDNISPCMNLNSISTLSANIKIKVEPLDQNGALYSNCHGVENQTFSIHSLKGEPRNYDEHVGDILDHMLLSQRINLLLSEKKFLSTNFTANECTVGTMPQLSQSCPTLPESIEPLIIRRPRKRKKTATNSVETALEEDAPGLLKVLLDNGITADEIKLYGEEELVDDALEESPGDGEFTELENVISKLFSERQSFLKFTPVRTAADRKTSYCLACLFSLVEQARYLRFRNWPAECGWCRDLQSFIFVFKRHNRIVLERPEYGYATYFFELVESLPVDWQIKRLVTAMKLTICSRVALIENKSLVVGEDLTEGEAQVLMGFGWIRNSGLGTMLNYHDRVVHDRRNEKETSEWRAKIGKLLMDGYNGGIIVSTIPKNLPKCEPMESPEVKLEVEY